MTAAWQEQLFLTPLAREMETAHRYGVGAAAAGLQDAGLGPVRLTGTAVPLLAEAAVTSATPFLRAPLLARLSRVRALHQPAGEDDLCTTCQVQAPCPTMKEIDR